MKTTNTSNTSKPQKASPLVNAAIAAIRHNPDVIRVKVIRK